MTFLGRIFVVLGIALLPACAAPLSVVPYAINEIPSLASPALPPTCDGVEPRGRLWIVFSSVYCSSCRELLNALADDEARVSELDIEVLQYLIDVDSCVAARPEAARSGGHPVGLANSRVESSWGVDATPTTFFVEDGRVNVVLHGSAPVEVLIAEQRRIDGE